MNERVKNIIFFLMVFGIIFNDIPNEFRMNFLGGLIQGKMVFYPIVIGLIYTLYCQYKYKNVLVNINKVAKFLLIYSAINIISLMIGIYNYPYYNEVLNGPVEQIEKLPLLISFFANYNIEISNNFLLIVWMIFRIIKSYFLEVIYTFIVAYMIYCWYYNNWKIGIKIMLYGIIASISIVCLYSFVEILYLSGNNLATNLLVYITPYIHAVKLSYNWWPPILWKEQLRSVFAELSYFGIYSAFILPFLWYKLFMEKEKLYNTMYILLMYYFLFCLFLTKARTGIVIFIGELLLLIILVMYLKDSVIIKKSFIIIFCTIIAFFSANYFIVNCFKSIDGQSENNISVQNYINDNVTSVISTDKRSNSARYSVIIANLKIGSDYPLFGVGLNLRNRYITDYLPEMSKHSGEVQMWITEQHNKGILKSGFPNLGEYSTRFAEMGLLGLIAFCTPGIILLWNLYKRIRDKTGDFSERIVFGFFFISFGGVLVSGFSNSLTILYCYWILLGLGYAMCFGRSNKDDMYKL